MYECLDLQVFGEVFVLYMFVWLVGLLKEIKKFFRENGFLLNIVLVLFIFILLYYFLGFQLFFIGKRY